MWQAKRRAAIQAALDAGEAGSFTANIHWQHTPWNNHSVVEVENHLLLRKW